MQRTYRNGDTRYDMFTRSVFSQNQDHSIILTKVILQPKPNHMLDMYLHICC